MSRPQYIDSDGEVWTYGPDINGDIGYHVEDGVIFPFAKDATDDTRMTFEDAIPHFGLIRVDDVTPAHAAFRRLRDAPVRYGTVTVSSADLELVLTGWEQWYLERLDSKREER